MSALALALHLVLAAPGPGLPPSLAPRLDPGPFQGRELAAASLGIVAGDAAVVAAAYYTLQLYANGALRPTAANFRTTAYAFGAAAVLVPPLAAVLLTRLFRAEPASGAVWKALLLAVAGQALALGAGYLAWPSYWVILPAQLLAIDSAATVGLHWGRGGPHVAPGGGGGDGDVRTEPADPAPAKSAATGPMCPDPALAEG